MTLEWLKDLGSFITEYEIVMKIRDSHP